MRNDLLGSEEVFVRITLYTEGTMEKEREYLNCYAFHNVKLNQIEVRMPSDPPNMIPRATFPMSLNPIVEHFGPHRIPDSPQKPAQRRSEPVLNDREWETLRQRLVAQQAQAAPAGTTAEKQEAAMKAFERDATPAEEQPDTKKFLEEVPKAEPSTEEGSGSDPNILETSSGKFALKIPLDPSQVGLQEHKLKQPIPAEDVVAVMFPVTGSGNIVLPNTLGPDTNSTPEPGAFDNRETRRLKGKLHNKHARPKQLPGATLLVAVALCLSLLFRHTS